MELVSILYSDPRQSFSSISLLFSGYTISMLGRVFGEQQEGAAEILSRIGVDSRAWKLTSSTHPRVGLGPIFTY